jgi:HEAT repeat protein
MSRSDLQLAADFARRWAALTKNRRARIANQIPVAAVQAAALGHPNLAMRRLCLFLLDHYASDASWNTFRRALRDPVASVREIALHGLSCERCRSEPLCVADVVVDLIDILASDPSAEVRHKAVILLARFVGRDPRAGEAIARASVEDPDAAIRHVARGIVEHGHASSRRKRALRAVRRVGRRHSALN